MWGLLLSLGVLMDPCTAALALDSLKSDSTYSTAVLELNEQSTDLSAADCATPSWRQLGVFSSRVAAIAAVGQRLGRLEVSVLTDEGYAARRVISVEAEYINVEVWESHKGRLLMAKFGVDDCDARASRLMATEGGVGDGVEVHLMDLAGRVLAKGIDDCRAGVRREVASSEVYMLVYHHEDGGVCGELRGKGF